MGSISTPFKEKRKLLKVAAFVTFPTFKMDLFEIHQKFKGHFLSKLRLSFKIDSLRTAIILTSMMAVTNKYFFFNALNILSK